MTERIKRRWSPSWNCTNACFIQTILRHILKHLYLHKIISIMDVCRKLYGDKYLEHFNPDGVYHYSHNKYIFHNTNYLSGGIPPQCNTDSSLNLDHLYIIIRIIWSKSLTEFLTYKSFMPLFDLFNFFKLNCIDWEK